MRLYKNSDGVWAGTQVDARRMCGKDYSEVDVPTDKPNLLKFLNLNKVGAAGEQAQPPIQIKEPTAVKKDAIAWFAWAYDKLQQGEYNEGKDMMRKALSMSSELMKIEDA